MRALRSFLFGIALPALLAPQARADAPAAAIPDAGFRCDASTVCGAAPRSAFNVDLGGSKEDVLYAMTPLPPAPRTPWPTGGVRLLGLSRDANDAFNIAFGHLLHDGSRDTGFSSDPNAARTSPAAERFVMDIQQDRSGRYLVLQGYLGVHLSRFLADGTPDANFGSGGTADLGFGDITPYFYRDGSLMLQDDGKIVAVIARPSSSATYGYEFVRVGDGGAIDGGFDGDGHAQPHLSGPQTVVPRALLQRRDGHWLLVGTQPRAFSLWTNNPMPDLGSGLLALDCIPSAGDDSTTCTEAAFDVATKGACSSLDTARHVFVDGVTTLPDGAVLGVGSFQTLGSPGVDHELAVLWPASGANIAAAECNTVAGRYFTDVHRTGSGSAIAAVSTSATTLALRGIGVRGRVLDFGDTSADVDWPGAMGTAALDKGRGRVAYRNGYAYLGATRTWWSGDSDFAVARYATDEIFSDGAGD